MACSTLGSNAVHDNLTIVGADITSLPGHALRELARVQADEQLSVIGGPPCQPFSKAAYWLDDGQESKYRQARARDGGVLWCHWTSGRNRLHFQQGIG